MNRDPKVWEKLGGAIRSDRERQGLTREDLVELLRKRGFSVTTRTIANLEAGIPPRRRPKPPSLEPTVAALGWPAGKVNLILEGHDPEEIPDVATPAVERHHDGLFADPMVRAVWESDLPREARVQRIRDLLEADLRRAIETEDDELRRNIG